MGKAISFSHDIAADVETVYAVISGEQWAAQKAEAFDDDGKLVNRKVAEGDAVTMTVSRALPDGVPGFLQKFLPAGGRVQQMESWGPAEAGARRGTWSGGIPGAPGDVGGTMALEPIPTGTRYVVKGEAKVSIPLIGGKAESFIVDMIGKVCAAESELLGNLTSRG